MFHTISANNNLHILFKYFFISKLVSLMSNAPLIIKNTGTLILAIALKITAPT